jgi:transcription elongation GreA/GreB family factor
MSIDKVYFVQQLIGRLKESEEAALRAEVDAREAARSLATESEKKEDGRVTLEYGSMATAQAARTRKAREELAQISALMNKGIPVFDEDSAISIGAVVDVSMGTESGPDERTFLLLPAGGGNELTGPSGDGFLSVLTPASPVGKALMGRKVGDSIEVTIRGATREWTILDVS